MNTGDLNDLTFQIVFAVVVAVRFAVPFAILRYPLPAIFLCLIVDAVDQTVFQAFGYDPPFYQGYDKAMDVFYLGVAYISMLRNWVSVSAFNVSRFLFFYRQVGVVAFELTQVRALLLVFPNTFEYFFMAYEAIRSRYSSLRLVMHDWLLIAAGIWILIKLPQEWWIHIAKLDVTDAIQEVAWFGPAIAIGIGLVACVVWFYVRPRLPLPDHKLQFIAPPIPDQVYSVSERAAYSAEHARVWSTSSLEKVLLVGLLSIVFASILPGVEVHAIRFLFWITIFVLANAFVTLILARHGWSSEAVVRSLLLRLIGNEALLWLIEKTLYPPIDIEHSSFFVLLFCVLVTIYDRYQPIYAFRRRHTLSGAAGL